MGVRLPAVRVTSKTNWAFLQDLVNTTSGTRGMALQSLLYQIEQLEEAVADWEAEIELLSAKLPAVHTLMNEAPGVGVALSATIVAEAWPVQRFRSAKAFARYSGLTPSDRSTGGRQIHGAITREGSRHLRWALTQAAMACVRAKQGPSVAAGNWIRAKEKRMGCKWKARTAGARKLAEQIWRLFHWGECFDPRRPFGATA